VAASNAPPSSPWSVNTHPDAGVPARRVSNPVPAIAMTSTARTRSSAARLMTCQVCAHVPSDGRPVGQVHRRAGIGREPVRAISNNLPVIPEAHHPKVPGRVHLPLIADATTGQVNGPETTRIRAAVPRLMRLSDIGQVPPRSPSRSSPRRMKRKRSRVIPTESGPFPSRPIRGSDEQQADWDGSCRSCASAMSEKLPGASVKLLGRVLVTAPKSRERVSSAPAPRRAAPPSTA
jgi:hypothetical protein